jgi:integrase
MASIKPVHRNNSVYIRVTIDRKSKYKKLFDLDKKYWDKKRSSLVPNCPNYKILSLKLMESVNHYTEAFININSQKNHFTHEEVLETVKTGLTLFDALVNYAQTIKRGSGNKYINISKHIKNYNNVSIDEVDFNYLFSLEQFLYTQDLAPTTIRRYLVAIKTVLRANNVATDAHNFSPISRKPKPKTTLTKAEIEKLENFNNKVVDLAKDIFLFSYYAWGSRISDVLCLRPFDIKQGRLVFTQIKSGKPMSIRITEKMQNIINRYEGGRYLFPVLRYTKPERPSEDERFMKHIESCTAQINRKLKLLAAYCQIEKRLTTHVARHTFAYTLIKNKNIPSGKLKDLLGHSSVATTEGYMRQLTELDDLDSITDDL